MYDKFTSLFNLGKKNIVHGRYLQPKQSIVLHFDPLKFHPAVDRNRSVFKINKSNVFGDVLSPRKRTG